MTRVLLLGWLCVLGLAPTVKAQDTEEWTPEQHELWSRVEARWSAWAADDFRAFAAEHHPQWQRWGFTSSDLLSTRDLEVLWEDFKKNEDYVGVRLEPVSLHLFGADRFAAVHYIAYAHVRWVGEAFTAPSGQRVEPGDETIIPMRWSDFLVREGDEWLYTGGYRDGNCGIWPGYRRPCAERDQH